MFVAILILLILPFVDTSNIKGSSFKPLFIVAFWIFALNFLVLMWLGSCHVEAPYIVAGQIATAYYFAHFLIIIPVFGIIDNVLSMIAISSHGLIHEEAKVEKFKGEEGEITEEEKTKGKEDGELYEFIYSVQNHTFYHIR
jgi:hypothetical protein